MKQKLLLLTALLFAVILSANAQISIKRVLENSKKRAENKIENRLENKIDNTVDDALDDVEGKNRKDRDKNRKNDQDSDDETPELIGSDDTDATEDSENAQSNTNSNETQTIKTPVVTWNKYDFVPGDKIIFEDGPSVDEENGEFPSRWDLNGGGAEIAQVDGEYVIMFLDDGGAIIPYLKNSSEDYLPEVFTVEMDVWFGKEQEYKRYWIDFYDNKNQKSNKTTNLKLYPNGLEYGASEKRYPGRENVNWGVVDEPAWKHISIAYTKGKFKAYMDDTRLINIPHLEGNPTGITIKSEAGSYTYIKNVRIAEGGVKYYDRAMQDGKIVVNGIRFDVGKATLKPESMGPINEIYSLMNKNPEINFSVEGHTDSDGNDATNQTLSEERAKTVMNKLIEMGIDKSRLKSQGFGESKPMNENTSAEGKAQNRRVEFVKF